MWGNILVNVISITILAALLTGQGNGQQVCKTGELACGLACYNSTDHQCLGRPLTPKICPLSDLLCARNDTPLKPVCYNPVEKECHASLSVETVCEIGDGVCEGSCYNKTTQVCLSDPLYARQTLCSNGQELCGSTCYSPDKEHCTRD